MILSHWTITSVVLPSSSVSTFQGDGGNLPLNPKADIPTFAYKVT